MIKRERSGEEWRKEMSWRDDFVASQVALHVHMNMLQDIRHLQYRAQCVPSNMMMHHKMIHPKSCYNNKLFRREKKKSKEKKTYRKMLGS